LGLLYLYCTDTELQVITALSLISTIYKSPQHSLSPFPTCCVFTSRSLSTASNNRHSSASCAQVLPSPTLVQNCLPASPSTELDRHLFSASLTELNCTQHFSSRLNCQPSTPLITTLYGPKRKQYFQKHLCCCLRICCPAKCLTSRCLAMNISPDSTIPAFRGHVTIFM
jgi:hypothetical protein